MRIASATAVMVTILMLDGLPANAAVNALQLFHANCAVCHAPRIEKIGPALADMPGNINELNRTIYGGRKLMPAFRNRLSDEEIQALVEYIRIFRKKVQ